MIYVYKQFRALHVRLKEETLAKSLNFPIPLSLQSDDVNPRLDL